MFKVLLEWEVGAAINSRLLVKTFERKELLNWFLKFDLECDSQRPGLASIILERLLCIGNIPEAYSELWSTGRQAGRGVG